VRWGHVGGTRINPLVDGSRMFQEMLRIRWNDVEGKYNGSAVLAAQTVKSLPQEPAPRV
jgi:hypothetical protein